MILKNILMVPSGSGGQTFINKMTRLVNLWTKDSPLENTTLKAIHVMPALLLQKKRSCCSIRKETRIIGKWKYYRII